MLKVLEGNQGRKGRPPTLRLAHQLLMSLSYWREYRILFHVGMTYGVSEPSASRIIRSVEDPLIQSGLLPLPKKLPQGQCVDWDVVLVDATAIEIERPKKTTVLLQRKTQNAYAKTPSRGSLLYGTDS